MITYEPPVNRVTVTSNYPNGVIPAIHAESMAQGWGITTNPATNFYTISAKIKYGDGITGTLGADENIIVHMENLNLGHNGKYIEVHNENYDTFWHFKNCALISFEVPNTLVNMFLCNNGGIKFDWGSKITGYFDPANPGLITQITNSNLPTDSPIYINGTIMTRVRFAHGGVMDPDNKRALINDSIFYGCIHGSGHSTDFNNVTFKDSAEEQAIFYVSSSNDFTTQRYSKLKFSASDNQYYFLIGAYRNYPIPNYNRDFSVIDCEFRENLKEKIKWNNWEAGREFVNLLEGYTVHPWFLRPSGDLLVSGRFIMADKDEIQIFDLLIVNGEVEIFSALQEVIANVYTGSLVDGSTIKTTKNPYTFTIISGGNSWSFKANVQSILGRFPIWLGSRGRVTIGGTLSQSQLSGITSSQGLAGSIRKQNKP